MAKTPDKTENDAPAAEATASGSAEAGQPQRQIVVHAQYVKDLSFENPNAKQSTHSNKLLWSLSKLDLDIKTDLNLIKKRYKELAKKHHPDIKGNSKNSIDKFREIVEAYNYLLERYKK